MVFPRFVVCAVLAACAGLGPLGAQEVPATLTLDAAVELALGQRQELAAAGAAVRAHQGGETQAALRPNPTFHLQSENWRGWQDPGFSPRTDLDLFAYVTDTIETAGKRRLRSAVAETETRASELERKVLEWGVRRAVSEAWWRAAGAEQRRGLLEQSRQTLSELVRFQQTRLDLGAIAEIDVIKVRVEDERLGVAVAGAEAEAEQARLALLAAMGTPGRGADFEIAGDPGLQGDETGVSADAAARRALESRPDLVLERALVTTARATVDLERAQAKPNLSPYFGYKKSGPFSTLVGGVTVPLPVRNRNQGRIAETLAEVERAEANVRALEARIQAEARAAAAEVERRRAIVDSIRSGVRERAAESFRIAREAYQEQGVDLLFLLDAQRSLNDVELLYAQSLLDYRLSRERLAAATGYAIGDGGQR